MGIAETMKQTQKEEEYIINQWALGEYIGECPNCKRQRLCRCTNGKSRCEKCNWIVEDNDYCVIMLP